MPALEIFKVKLLLIETATQVCSVAIADEGGVIAERRSTEPNAHSSQLTPFITQLLEACGLRPADIGAVCVSAGPGSYTGLRIGVSTAKGLCYALGIPLLSVPTLQSMAAQYYVQHPGYDGLVCPMIDARRMECYTAFYANIAADGQRTSVSELRGTQADIIAEGIYDDYLYRGPVTFIGDGAPKCFPLLSSHPNARLDAAFAISAAGLLPVALQKLESGQQEDVAYFEPFYLKDFVAKKSVVRGLR